MNLETIMKSYNITVEEILNSIRVGIFVTDGEGKTITLNDECCKTGGMEKEEIIGKTVQELMEIGYVVESDSMLVMGSKHEESLIQNLGDGGQIFITGVPIFRGEDIKLIISTERNITETMNLRALLKEKEEVAEQYKDQINLLKQSISNNDLMKSENARMQQLLDVVKKISKVDTTVLILGESGTGKELIANFIFNNSGRSNNSFIKINCAAIPDSLLESEFFGYEKGAFTGAEKGGKKGIFEAADQGTLFLDEVAELPIQMQAKLLRVLQEKEIRRIGSNTTIPIDVRIIAATNKDLSKEVREGRFREDLYYRLNIAPVEVPPLRNRKEDICKLAQLFLTQFNLKYGMSKRISPEAIRVLEDYYWPGNIRELQNIIERIVIKYDSGLITKFQIYKQLNGVSINAAVEKNYSLSELVDDYEKNILIEYYDRFENAANVAKALNVDRSTISRKLKKYNISK